MRTLTKIDKCDFCNKKAEYVGVKYFFSFQMWFLCEDHRLQTSDKGQKF